ncbi:MAG: EAL domain-containing protein [Acidimicrobiales bacterium]
MKPVVRPDGLDEIGAELFLGALVRSSEDAVIGKTPDGRVVFWNAAAERLYGYQAVEMVGRDISLLVPDDRPEELAMIMGELAEGRTTKALQTERRRKDGAIVPVSVTVSPVIGEDGTVIGASTIARDLTQHIEQVRALEEAERRAAEALSTLETWQASAPIGLGFVDRDCRVVHMNEVLAATTGSRASDQIGRTVAELVPEIWPQVEPVYRRVLEQDEAVLNIEVSLDLAGAPGNRRYWLASYYPVHLGTEVIGVGIIVVDVTERRQADEFRSIALNQMTEGLIATDEQGRMTYMNAAVTRMLGWTEEDLKDKHLHDVIHTQHEDGRLIESEAECAHNRVRTEGTAMHQQDLLFTRRDGSLLPVSYSAAPIMTSGLGAGTVIVFRDITEEKAERVRVKRELDALSWVGRIREALDEDRLVLYSQPIVPLTGGDPSEELLLRMVSRDGQVIAPGAFLGVAERYGLITEIDRWVVKQGARLAAQGRRVGVNLSAESVVSPGMLALIDHEIDDAEADHSNLMFEITETSLMRDIGKGEDFARGLVARGFEVALDDFGTGFGTFTHVKKLPIKYLKIDIEFVRDLVTSTANEHVVKAIVNLAQGFGCKTIAEGVEDEETLSLLRGLGVDYAQGYHLGRPAPIVARARAVPLLT